MKMTPLGLALALAFVAPALASTAFAKTPATSAATRSATMAADKRFLEKADAANAKELAAAKLAEQKATRASVRDYAKHMLTDHGAMAGKLASTAAQAGVTLSPHDMDMADGHGKGDAMKNANGMTTAERAAHKAGMNHDPVVQALAAHTGADFDRAYVGQMVTDHRMVVADFTKASKDQGLSAPVRMLASNSLPTLRKHLAEAEALRAAK